MKFFEINVWLLLVLPITPDRINGGQLLYWLFLAATGKCPEEILERAGMCDSFLGKEEEGV